MNKKVMCALVLILILVIGGGFWIWKEKEAKKMEEAEKEAQQMKEQNKQTAKPETNNGNNISKKGIGGAQEIDGEYYFLIPEMGVKFKIKKELKDELVYNFGTTGDKYNNKGLDQATFSTKELSLAGVDCEPQNAPLGSLVKYKGKLANYGNGFEKITEAFIADEFFILFVGPQATCTEDEKYINKKTGYINIGEERKGTLWVSTQTMELIKQEE